MPSKAPLVARATLAALFALPAPPAAASPLPGEEVHFVGSGGPDVVEGNEKSNALFGEPASASGPPVSYDAPGQVEDDYAIFVQNTRTDQIINNYARPSISADGTKILFTHMTAAAGEQVFLHDTETGAIQWVSLGGGGLLPTAPSNWATISPDGRYAVFVTAAQNIVGDMTSVPQVVAKDLRNLSAPAVVLSRPRNDGSALANQVSFNPVFSPDGSKLAFETLATNLVDPPSGAVYPGDTNGVRDIYVLDIGDAPDDADHGSVALATVGGLGAIGMGESLDPAFSPDGRFLAFASLSNLDPLKPNNGFHQVYVKSLGPVNQGRVTGAVTLWSRSASVPTIVGNGPSRRPAFSPDGREIAFQSDAANIFPKQAVGNEIIVKTMTAVAGRPAEHVRVISLNGSENLGVNTVTFESPVYTPDGRGIIFTHEFTNGLTPGLAIMMKEDVHDDTVGQTTSGTRRYISRFKDGGTRSSALPAVAINGRVAFLSTSKELIAADTQANTAVFVVDLMPNADGGPDDLSGLDGSDRLFGGAGDDKLDGGTEGDVLVGGDGMDELEGGVDGDLLSGGYGADQLSGGSGDDEERGGPGDDVILAAAGADVAIGGMGEDRFRVPGPRQRYEIASDGNGWFEVHDRLSGGSGTDRVFGVEWLDVVSGATITSYAFDEDIVNSNNRAPAPVITSFDILPGAVRGNFAVAADPDGDAVTLTPKTAPLKGTLQINDAGKVSYIAGPTAGSDSFTVTAKDAFGGTADITVAVAITSTLGPDGLPPGGGGSGGGGSGGGDPSGGGSGGGDPGGVSVNLAPLVAQTLVKTRATAPKRIAVASAPVTLARDPEGKAIAYVVLAAPKKGKIVNGTAPGTLVYVPTAVAKSDAMRIRALDPEGAFVEFDVRIALGVVVRGNARSNRLTGGPGDDGLIGLGGNDVLLGGAENDVLDGGAGVDTLYGGPGNDTYRVDRATDRVRESAGQGRDTVQSPVTFRLPAQVENLTLVGDKAVNGTGNGLANTITGNARANVLKGGDGSDMLAGLGGADRLEGGSGVDTATYAASGKVSVNLATGRGSHGHAAGDRLAGVENLVGGNGDDTLVGNGGPNVLVGGRGRDRLTGGAGADRFVYRAPTDSTPVAYDVITDAKPAEGDVIDLSPIDADPVTPGRQNFKLAAALTTVRGAMVISQQGQIIRVMGDRDGNGQPDLEIRLTSPTVPTAAMFKGVDGP